MNNNIFFISRIKLKHKLRGFINLITTIFYIFFTTVVLIFINACTINHKTNKDQSLQKDYTPTWVFNKDKIYHENDWLIGTGKGITIEAAENSAISNLAQQFNVDINTHRNYNEIVSESWSTTPQNNFDKTTKNVTDVLLSSNVKGIIGLIVDNWTNIKTSEVHAIARINRIEWGRRYSEIISENDRNISLLLEKSNTRELIEKTQLLNSAYNLALLTDDLKNINAILTPSTKSLNLSYGSSISIFSKLIETKKEMIIYVEVSDDVNGRLHKAFTNSLNSRGFNTGLIHMSNYLLQVNLEMENVTYNNTSFEYVRYTINYSFSDRDGKELFSNSITDREGDLAYTQARQRAISSVEKWISNDGFANDFDNFLNNK